MIFKPGDQVETIYHFASGGPLYSGTVIRQRKGWWDRKSYVEFFESDLREVIKRPSDEMQHKATPKTPIKLQKHSWVEDLGDTFILREGLLPIPHSPLTTTTFPVEGELVLEYKNGEVVSW